MLKIITVDYIICHNHNMQAEFLISVCAILSLRLTNLSLFHQSADLFSPQTLSCDISQCFYRHRRSLFPSQCNYPQTPGDRWNELPGNRMHLVQWHPPERLDCNAFKQWEEAMRRWRQRIAREDEAWAWWRKGQRWN